MSETHGQDFVPVDFDPFADDAPRRLPLTPPQVEVWVESQMGPEASCAFNQCFVLRLRGLLSVTSMQNALNTVLARHAALRSTFDEEATTQTILPTLPVAIRVHNLMELPPTERSAALDAIIAEETRQPFDLAKGPLLRARLVHESADLHRLVLTVHHIVCDGWSSSVLLSDWAAAYAADRFGLSPTLPEAMSYEAYVEAAFAQPDAAADEDYWLRQFENGVPVLDLPGDRKRPALRSRSGARRELGIDAELYRKLKSLAAKNGATLFHTLLAAFETLLSRLSGQSDFVVGMPIAGQLHLENSHIVAHCVSTLPLRCRVASDLSFADFLRQVRTGVLDAQGHARVTFSSLLPKLKLDRDLSSPALVSVVFNVDKLGAKFEFGDLVVEHVDTPKQFVTFDLNVNVVDSGTSLVIEFDYNTDLFDAATIERWLGHYQVLLSEVARDPAQSLAKLDFLSAAERRQLIIDWNRTERPLPEVQRIHEMFEIQASRTPDAEALVAGDVRLRFGELEARANQLAHHLQAAGARPGDCIGVCLPRTADLIVALLAVLKTGSAYVPLDPVYPIERIAFMLQDSGAALVITQESLARTVPTSTARHLLIDRERDAIAAQPTRRLGLPGEPHDLAYVIYTSGSTGKPKGVAIEHRNAAAFIDWASSVFDSAQIAGVLAGTSVCFDLSIFEIFFPLAHGGRIILVDNALALATLPARGEVTLLNTVPSAAAELVAARAIPPGVTTVNLAGEPLATSLVDALYALGTIRQVYDLYGPTEDTTYSTVKLRLPAQPPTVGRPIANGRAYVLDQAMSPVPIGIPGELYLGGAGVARGYLNRPALTAERFLPDPFRPGTGDRIYRTGDLARYRPDGEIEYLGRLDHQVKIRGFRIELGEIEAEIRSHPAVRESAVITREARPGDVRIIAYVVVQEGEDLTVSEVRKHLRAKLPDYMLPSFVVMVPALPLTANGKLDRGALPDPFRSTPSDVPAHEPPAPGMEQRLAEIWREALKFDGIGAGDNFFELGGHSLLAVRVAVAVEKQTGWRLNPRVLFFQTLRQVAASIEAAVRQPITERLA